MMPAWPAFSVPLPSEVIRRIETPLPLAELRSRSANQGPE